MRIALVLATIALVACAAPVEEGVGSQEGELGAEPRAAGITEGSLEEEGVVVLVNDRLVDPEMLIARGVDRAAARGIGAFRTNTDGTPRWFDTLDDVDALPGTDASTFGKLVTIAKAGEWTEAPGFDPPDKMRFEIPDGLDHRPTSRDVRVNAGFDGKSPDEVLAIVKSRLRNTVHVSNRSFVDQTILETHHAFSIAINNLFAPGSPHATFVKELGADKLTMLGTMSAMSPTILVAETAGSTTFYTVQDGHYAPIPKPGYPVIMRARIRVSEPGVRVFYPSWKAKVLAGPTGVIIEGGG